MRDALFLAISQSGRSPDLLTLAEAARADGALTVALVNDTALAARRALRSRAAAQCLAGAERRGDQVLYRFARRACCSSFATGARTPRSTARCSACPPISPRRPAATGRRPCRRSRRGAEPLRGRRAGRASRAALGGRAQAQGDLRPPRRGAERRGADARADGAGSAGFPGRSSSASATRRSPASPSSPHARRPRRAGDRGRPGGAPRHDRASRRRRAPSLRPADRPGAELLSARRGARPRPRPRPRPRRRTSARSRRRGDGGRPAHFASAGRAVAPVREGRRS